MHAVYVILFVNVAGLCCTRCEGRWDESFRHSVDDICIPKALIRLIGMNDVVGKGGMLPPVFCSQ